MATTARLSGSRHLIALITMLLLAFGPAAMIASAQTEATPAATPAPAVVREVINEGEPAAAPGMTLQLVQYTIPGEIELPVHTHPGMQVNVIVSGTLTYTVVEGTAMITRADGTMETLSAGETTDMLPGDALTEPEGMVHFGVNTREEPIVILTASLFTTDEAPSTVVDVATPAP